MVTSIKKSESNLGIKNDFFKLDSVRKTHLVNRLSFKGRDALLKIIKTNGAAHVNDNACKELKNKIEKIPTTFKLDFTRRDDTRKSPLYRLRVKLVRFASRIASIFNLMTGERANRLIQKAISSEISKKDSLPSVSHKKLDELIEIARQEAGPKAKVDLSAILQKNGFSTRIEDQNISLENVNLDGITFNLCKFDWNILSGASLKNVIFTSCEIHNLSLMNSHLENCRFINCEMREVMFTGADLRNTAFEASSLISCSFEDASLKDCAFENCSLPATHFLEAGVKTCKLADCNLEDAVFFGTLERFEADEKTANTAAAARPIGIFLVNPEVRGFTLPKMYMKMDQKASILPLRITMQSQKTTKEGVNREVEAALERQDKNSSLSIAQNLLKKIAEDPDSECAKILRKANILAGCADAFLLPGGEDVPPALYGQATEEPTEWGDDYRRSILELAIIHESYHKGIPLMAVCRGFQLAHVYFGSHLIQDIKGQQDLQKYELSESEKRGLYTKVMENNLVSVSYHHQAVPKENDSLEYLEPSVIYDELIKASELRKSGAVPMILLQFHPEFYESLTADSLERELLDFSLNIVMSEKNEGFWDILRNSAQAHRIKKIAISEIRRLSTGIGNKK